MRWRVAAEATLRREARLVPLTLEAPSTAMDDGTKPEVSPGDKELLFTEMPSPAKRAAKAAPRLWAGDSGIVGPELVDDCSDAMLPVLVPLPEIRLITCVLGTLLVCVKGQWGRCRAVAAEGQQHAIACARAGGGRCLAFSARFRRAQRTCPSLEPRGDVVQQNGQMVRLNTQIAKCLWTLHNAN